jgi:hypothetical protein
MVAALVAETDDAYAHIVARAGGLRPHGTGKPRGEPGTGGQGRSLEECSASDGGHSFKIYLRQKGRGRFNRPRACMLNRVFLCVHSDPKWQRERDSKYATDYLLMLYEEPNDSKL